MKSLLAVVVLAIAGFSSAVSATNLDMDSAYLKGQEVMRIAKEGKPTPLCIQIGANNTARVKSITAEGAAWMRDDLARSCTGIKALVDFIRAELPELTDAQIMQILPDMLDAMATVKPQLIAQGISEPVAADITNAYMSTAREAFYYYVHNK